MTSLDDGKYQPWSSFRGNSRNSGRSNYIGPSTNELKWSITTGDSITSTAAVAADGTVYFGSNDFNLYSLSSYGTLLWKFTTDGVIASSPTIGINGTIYVGSYDLYFYAITSFGSLLWKYKTGNSIDSSPAIGSANNISSTSSIIYFTSNDMFLYALSSQSGSLLWQHQTTNNGYLIRILDTADITSSPVVDFNGNVYIGSKDYSLYSFSSTGTLLWTFLAFSDIYSSPVLSNDENTIYIASSITTAASNVGYVYAVSALTGSLIWNVKLSARIFATPVLDTDGTLYCITRSLNDLAFLYSISSTGSMIWQSTAYKESQASPVLSADGTLYFSTGISMLYAVSSKTGSMIWSHNYPSTAFKTSSPCIGLNGFLYVGSYDSVFYAYQTSTTYPTTSSTDGYQVDSAWSHFRGNGQYSGQSNLLGPTSVNKNSNSNVYVANDIQLYWKYQTQGKISATPAIAADGTIYIGSVDGKLYALSSQGTVKWSYLINSFILITTPAIGYDGTVFVTAGNNYLYAFTSEGALLWKQYTYETIYNCSPLIAISSDNSAPTIYVAGRLYLFVFTYEGTLKWKYTLTAATYMFSSPILGMDGSIIYTSTSDSYLYALSTTDGSLLWKYRFETPSFSEKLLFTPAIGAGDVIYFATYDSYLYAVSSTGLKLWKYQYSDAVAIPNDMKDALLSGVAITSNGIIYIGSKDYFLYAISTSQTGGSTLWQYKTQGEIYNNPVIGADGTVYFGSFDQNVYAVSSLGSLLWKYSTFSVIVGSAVIGDNNTLYIGSRDGYIYAIISTQFNANTVSSTMVPTSVTTKSNFHQSDNVKLSNQLREIVFIVISVVLFVVFGLIGMFLYKKSKEKNHEKRLLEMKSWILSDGGGDVKVATSMKEKLQKELFLDDSFCASDNTFKYGGSNTAYSHSSYDIDSSISGHNTLALNISADVNYDSVAVLSPNSFNGNSNHNSYPNTSRSYEKVGDIDSSSKSLLGSNNNNNNNKVNEYIQADQQLTQVTNSLKAINRQISRHVELLHKQHS